MAELSASIYQHLLNREVPLDPFAAMQQGQRSAFGQLALQEARRQRQVEEQTRALYRQYYGQGGQRGAPQAGMASQPGAVQETVNTPYSSDLQAMLSQYQQEGADVTPTPGARGLPGAGPQTLNGPAAMRPGASPQAGVDTSGLVRALYQLDPQAAQAAEKAAQESQIGQLEMVGKQSAMVSQVARSILLQDTQQAYEVGVNYLRQAGIPVDHLPPLYDRRMVEHYYGMSTDAETRVKEAQSRLIGTQATLAPRKLAVEERQETRLEQQRLLDEEKFALDIKKYGLQEAEDLRKEREEQRKTQEFEGGLYPYTTDTKHNMAINRRMQAAGLPRGSTPPPELLAGAEQDVLSGAVEVSEKQGAEQARIKREQEPLDPTTAKAVSDIGVLQDMTDDVTDLFDPGYVGQFEGRWGAVKAWTGQAPQRQVVFQRVVADMKDQLLRARSGAAITESEYARLSTMVPGVTDNEETFKAKLLGFRRALDQTKQRKLETATTARGQLRGQQPGVTPLPERKQTSRAAVQQKLKPGWTIEQAVEYYRQQGYEVTE